MHEPRSDGPRDPLRRKIIKGALASGALVALGKSGLIGRAADHFLGTEKGIPYQTFPLPEYLQDGRELDKLYEELRIQLMEGDNNPNVPKGIVNVVDFNINVEEGTSLRARYTPDASTGLNRAVVFNPGAHYDVQGAIEVKGETVRLDSGESSNRWLMIPGNNFGKSMDLFIFRGPATAEKVKITNQTPKRLLYMNPAQGIYRVADPEDLTQTSVLLQRNVHPLPKSTYA